jgi:hypothetical protein
VPTVECREQQKHDLFTSTRDRAVDVMHNRARAGGDRARHVYKRPTGPTTCGCGER